MEERFRCVVPPREPPSVGYRAASRSGLRSRCFVNLGLVGEGPMSSVGLRCVLHRPGRADPLARGHPHTHLVGEGLAGQPADTLEYDILSDYVAAQCCALVRRRSYEGFLLVRTLGDYRQHGAWEAKCGRTSIARVQMQALKSLHPSAEETVAGMSDHGGSGVGADRVEDGRPRPSTTKVCALGVLRAGYFLWSPLLDLMRIYLASHVARVYSSLGATAKAVKIATALIAT